MKEDRRTGASAWSKALVTIGLVIMAVVVVGAILVGVVGHQVLHQGESEARRSSAVNALVTYDETISCLEAGLAGLKPEADDRGVRRAMKHCTDGSFFFTFEGQTQPRLLQHHNLSVVMSTEVADGDVTFVVDTVGHGSAPGSFTSTEEALTVACWTIRVDVAERAIVGADDAECDPEGAGLYQFAKQSTMPDLRRNRGERVATEVEAGTSGIVTALGVKDGGVIRDGDMVATIDGVTMVAYAAERPMGDDDEKYGLYGSSSTATLQRILLQLGYYKGSVDGMGGTLTREAVAAFNKDMGVTADLEASSPATFAWIGPQRFAITDVRVQAGDKVHHGDALVSGSSAWWPYPTRQ